jgi:hypothetical protein
MDGTWLTYAELGVRLGTSAEGARRRVPDQSSPPGPSGLGDGFEPLGEALEGSDGAVSSLALMGELRAQKTKLLSASLESHVATLKADVDRLEALLAGERERADAETAKSGNLPAQVLTPRPQRRLRPATDAMVEKRGLHAAA